MQSTTIAGRSDARRNDCKVFDAMVAHMRFRDRVCFASRATLAADVGLSVKTVQRCQERLVARGKIVRGNRCLESGRRVRTCVWRVPSGERRMTKCPTTPVGRNPKPSTPHYVRGGATWRCRLSEIERRPAREITARDVLAAAIDTMAIHDVPVTGRAKGMIARQAKELLADGFKPDTVLAAAVIAIRRGEPQNTHFIAQDIVLTQSGQRLSRKDYEGELRAASDRLHPQKAGARKRLLDVLGVDEGKSDGQI